MPHSLVYMLIPSDGAKTVVGSLTWITGQAGGGSPYNLF